MIFQPIKKIVILMSLILSVFSQASAETPDIHRSGCIDIKSIHLIGDSAEQFQWAIKAVDYTEEGTIDKAIGSCLTNERVKVLMYRIQNAIVARGFITTRVLMGRENHMKEGILEFTLLPGRIRYIQLAPDTTSRATQWNAFSIKSVDLLNLRDLEQALENFKRVPSVEADIEIVAVVGPGVQQGQSDLIIQWKQNFPLRVTVSIDDSGTKAMGKYQGNVAVSYDHPLMLNDLLYLSLNHDLGVGRPSGHGTRGYTAYYSLPMGYSMLGLTTSKNQYHQLVPSVSQAYLYSGESYNHEIKLSRVVYRDAVRKTTLSLGGWGRSSNNFIDDAEIKVQHRRMAGWTFGLAHRAFIDRATIDLNLHYRRGTLALGSLVGSEGGVHPKIMTTTVELNLPFQLVDHYFRYNSVWQAQWNQGPLGPQDRFAIGGRYTVRGFNGENQLLAEHGWVIRNNLGLVLRQGFPELYMGVDYGQVGGPSSHNLIGHYLSGTVMGVRQNAKAFSYDVFVGRPLFKPNGFDTPSSVAGFSLSISF